MISFSFFINAKSEEEAAEVVKNLLTSINPLVSTFEIVSIEDYKEGNDQLQKVLCDVSLQEKLTQNLAIEILNEVSDNWQWNRRKTGAVSSENMTANFTNPLIKFVSCHFFEESTDGWSLASLL